MSEPRNVASGGDVDDWPPLECHVCGRGTWKEFVFPDEQTIALCRKDEPASASDLISVLDHKVALRKQREDGVD